MGHPYYAVEIIDQIRRKKNYTEPPKVMDLGSQDFYCLTPEDKDATCQLIVDAGGDPAPFLEALGPDIPAQCEARIVFTCLGYDYHCCDVDHREGTVYVDLNAMPAGNDHKNTFDIVLNSGTTEHIINTPYAFFYMHHIVKPGGFIYNYVPLFGFGNHGLVNHTPKFWHTLIWMNQYALIKGQVIPIDEDAIGMANVYQSHLSQFEGLEKVLGTSHMMMAIVEKTRDGVFIPPMDAIISPHDDGQVLGRLVAGGLRMFWLAGLLSDEEIWGAVNDFLNLNAKSYQFALDEIQTALS